MQGALGASPTDVIAGDKARAFRNEAVRGRKEGYVGDSCLIKVQLGGCVMGSARATVTITASENERTRDLMRSQDLSRGEAARRAIQESVSSLAATPPPCSHARELEELRERARALSVECAKWRSQAEARTHPEEPAPDHPPWPQSVRLQDHSPCTVPDARRDRGASTRIVRIRRRDGTSYLAWVVQRGQAPSA